ncbi:STAS domain-containing protein [Niveibacterium terrae]|uniref:STAS domain-containing protein n=1 Tax=Niveibacterium terrae TaxID=3373598 RepID=UPI003A90A476
MKQILTTGSPAATGMTQNCLVVTLQADLYDDLLDRVRQTVIDRIAVSLIRGTVFDLSSVRVLDTHIMNHLTDTAKVAQLMGVQTAFVGFRPGVVSALIDLGIEAQNIKTFRTVEEGVAYLVASSEGERQRVKANEEASPSQLDAHAADTVEHGCEYLPDSE